jgi:DNA-binding ferritin-like protein
MVALNDASRGWTVKGPSFIALHELFDKINEEVEEYVDGIAELWALRASTLIE